MPFHDLFDWYHLLLSFQLAIDCELEQKIEGWTNKKSLQIGF